MKNFTTALTIVLLTAAFASKLSANPTPPADCTSKRSTLFQALVTNTKQTVPLLGYGILAAYTGANLAHSYGRAGAPEHPYQVPGTNAAYHAVWTAAIFGYANIGKLLEVDVDKRGAVLGESAVTLMFVGAIMATGYFTGAPVALGVTAAFVGASILRGGDRSPIEYVKPNSGVCI